MRIFITRAEGEYWEEFTEEEFLEYKRSGKPLAAVRIGDWIYDLVLAKLGYSPIRFQWYAPEVQ